MKNSIFIILFVICPLLSGVCYAQSQFQLAIGGGNVDGATTIIQTTDGGIAVAGSSQSFGTGGMYIVKFDVIGNLNWSRIVGISDYDGASSIVQTTDGGYAVVGSIAFGGDPHIVKLDVTGNIQWRKVISPGGTGSSSARSIIQTTDNGLIIAGSTQSFGAGSSDFYFFKLNSSGTLQWSRTVGGSGYDDAFSIIQTTDGGYALAGQTNSFGAVNNDVYIVKFDASGTLQWSRTVGGAGSDNAFSIIQTTDGGYALAGQTNSFGAGNMDIYIVKFDAGGTLQWSRTVGGEFEDLAYSIVQTTDGGFAVAGSTQSFGTGPYDMYVVKLNSSGTLQWSKTIGGVNDDYAYSIIRTTDGGFAVAGYTNSFGAGGDIYFVKLDSGGNTCGNSFSPPSSSGTGGSATSPTPTVTSPTSPVTLPPYHTGTGGTLTSICVIGIQPISSEMPMDFSLSQNYPNPFNPTTKIRFALPKSSFAKIVIYDALGREVETIVSEQLNAGTYEADWSADKFSSGVYYYKLTAGDYTGTKKMILIK